MPPTITGHRGAMGLEPENTLRSFRRAVAEGCDEIELDLRLSADGHLVLLHDADLARTGGPGHPIADLTLAQIRALDPDPETRVPTFAEAVGAIPIRIQAEIKDPAVAPTLAGLLNGDPGLAARTLVTSFDAAVLREMRWLRPGTPVGLITHRAPATGADLVGAARSAGAGTVLCGITGLTRHHVDACHAAGLRITAWPVPDPQRFADVVAMGVDGVTTDNPHLLRAAPDAA
ncbi:glycerophosphodiester phosphodiesterase [Nocardiopsis sediminis]|uniref:Glycerophosphodiester phosphodiesterase n=1 Tax=Nocardiopsis sediminis TaxID=1778267 RepID=A0ABV8FRW7_9ACTN